MSIEAAVQSAIQERRVLRFACRGDESGARVGHPHAIYIGALGEARVAVFQVDGFAATGALPRWRSFTLMSIASAEPLPERFEPATGWDPFDPRYAGGIVAMV